MQKKQSVVKLIVVSMTGHCLEWYDFAIYGYMATVFAELFFPSYSPTAGLIASLAVFAIGVIARPAGALCLGYLGDKYGRKTILITSLFLMTFATVSMGLLPTYSQIGIGAPLMLLFLRIVQGFSAAGETSTSIVYLIERAPFKNRSFMAGWIVVGFVLGNFLALMITFFLSHLFLERNFTNGDGEFHFC